MQNPIRSQNPKSEIQNPKSKIQDPKSKIQNPKSKIQDPKSKIQNPNGRVWGCHKKNGYYDNPKSKIQDPKSKIQDPKSKIQNPKSKIQNPKSKIQNPKSKLQTPKSKLQTARLDFGCLSLDLGGRAEPRFPALRRGNWGPFSRKIVESCGVPSNFSMRDTFLLGREIFRANIIGKVDWSLSMQVTFCNKKTGMAFYSLSHHCSRIFTSRIWNHSATKAVKKTVSSFPWFLRKDSRLNLKLGCKINSWIR